MSDAAAQPASALVDPVFRRYLAARAVGMAGATLTLVALPLLVYQRSGSAALTALVTVLETAPYLLLGLPAGALADRWRRRRVLVLTGCLSGAAMLSVPLAEVLGLLTTAQLLVVAATTATMFVFADAATFGVVPQMVGRARVASATSTLVSVGTAIGVAGPLVAGVAVTLTSPALVLGVDAAASLVSAAVLARLRWPGSEERQGSRGATRRLRSEVAEGLRFVWRHRVVRWLTVLGVGNSLAGGAAAGLLVVVGVEQLGLDADSPALGWLFAAGALGTFLGSLLLPRLQRHLGVGLITTAGYATAGGCLLLLAGAGSVAHALPVLLLMNLAMTTLIVNGIVTRQVVTPDRLQSRVGTTARLIAWGGAPLGAALGGVLAETAGTAWALRVAAACVLTSLVGAGVVGLWRFPRLAELSRPQPG
ncbi:MFS transporter [Nocardioides nanhaiensis]|uniref:MFS transporter n=1 Tax=Nocardioides nanhaiensis TaxID=1476871 RepID=A0ABP8WCL4_9ACTN